MCKSFKGPVLAGECGRWSLITWATFAIQPFTFASPDIIPLASIVVILLPNSNALVTSSTNLTIIFAIAFPKRTPIFSAAPPVSSTGFISFLNHSTIALIGASIGEIALPIRWNNGINGCKPSFNPCHIPLKKAEIGFQYL